MFGKIEFLTANELSRKIAQSDADIEEYFFSLNYEELKPVLIDYGKRYGDKAGKYAKELLPKWRARTVRMSELEAKRLYDLLPPRMPTRKKYELAGNLRRRFGPASQLTCTIGPDTDINEIAAHVTASMDQTLSQFRIPKYVINRFKWLAAGDARLAEDFLRQAPKDLAVQRIKAEVPILQEQHKDNNDTSKRQRGVIRIDNHVIEIWVDEAAGSEVHRGTPNSMRATPAEKPSGCAVLVLIGLAPVLWVLSR